LIITEGAAHGLERCRQFLLERSPQIARREAQAMDRQFARLQEGPEVGRPFPALSELRELIIEFGDPGYVALYRHERAADAVYVLAFRHQKKQGTEHAACCAKLPAA
jgi:plasmid stabilization system protein ParE